MMLGRIQMFDASLATSAFVSAWQWWLGELRQMLPPGIRTALQSRWQPVIVDIRDGQVVVSDLGRRDQGIAARLRRTELTTKPAPAVAERTAAPILHDVTVHLRLPPQQMLRRAVDLPLAAARNLPEILRFEIERLSPIDPAATYWDWRVISRSRPQNKLRVEMWLARKDDIDTAVRLCDALRLLPTAIGIVGEDPGVHVTRLLPRGRRAAVGSFRRFVSPALAVTAFVLALVLLHSETARQQAGIDQLQARIEKARAGAQVAERLRQEIRQVNGRIGFVAGKKEEPLAIAVLADVTRQLPEDAWLVQFQLNAREVRIQGFAPKASALIELFGQSSRFANVQFRAPVTRGPRGDLERFDLSFDVRVDK